ncbi:MAG TPA: DUF6285 domain-containing protein [Myxococcales bacterium]|nr:DUF6285 domain-containing protein [Myxococcales bacterium]
MADRPGAAELAEAVREFLEAEVLPVVEDARLRFRVLVAANALAIAQRDLEIGDRLLEEEIALLERLVGTLPASSVRERRISLNREVARRVRRGEVPEGTLEALRRIADLKLRAASPRYLERRNRAREE